MSKNIALSKNYLVSLSTNPQTIQKQPQPILQILGFETCYYNPNTQIIIRLSDQTTFIDCSLIGSYCVLNDKIVSKQNYVSIEFQKNDLVRLSDFYMKIDNSRICKLRIVIRKMHLADKCQQRKGSPFQLAQYIQYCQRQDKAKAPQPQVMNTNQKIVRAQCQNISKQVVKIQEDDQKMQIMFNINDKNYEKSQKNLINLDKDEKLQESEQNKNQTENQDRNMNKNNIQKRLQPNNKKPQGQSLTLPQILNNQEGFFIGRLLRIKLYTKQTKDGSLSILILGFVDRLGNIVRVNLAGKWALKQAREVKKNRCYYISALETVRLNRTNILQIRLKDKETKLIQIDSEKLCRDLMITAFYWDHEHCYPQDVEDDYSQNVDVVGMIEDIEQKTKYQYKHVPQGRQVIRIVVINRLKTVKISFWGHLIKVLQDMKLKKKMNIVLMDIKRKKNSYLDFTVESSFIKLEEDPLLRKQLESLLPELEQRQAPKNIEQLSKIIEQQAFSFGKTYSLNLFLTSLDQNRLIFKLCQKCKQKLDLECYQCRDCKSWDFYYKYNCQIELADWSGSIGCFLFDHCANKVLGMTAVEMIQVRTQNNSQNLYKIEQKIQQCLFKQFEVGLQMRNRKIIIKSMRIIEEDSMGKYIKSNIMQIKNKLSPTQIK